MTESVKCTRCSVTVPVDQIKQPFPYTRCTDPNCPLNTAEENAKLKASEERARG